MKLRNKFLCALYGLPVLIMGFAALGTSFANKPEEVEAAAVNSRTMYLKVNNDNWNSGNPAFQLHVWGDGVTDSYHNFGTFNYTQGLYKITYSVSNETNFQIVLVDAKTQSIRSGYSQDCVFGESNFFVVNNDGNNPSVTQSQCGEVSAGKFFVNATASSAWGVSVTSYLYFFNEPLGFKNQLSDDKNGNIQFVLCKYSNFFLGTGSCCGSYVWPI